VQGVFMTKQQINLTDSVLDIKASGCDVSDRAIAADLNLPEGKTIAELLNEQKEKNRQ
jgi:hypothetical protein